jgi:hypothetical protein
MGLYGGDQLIAIKLAMCSHGVLHGWFLAYDVRFATYSPGTVKSVSGTNQDRLFLSDPALRPWNGERALQNGFRFCLAPAGSWQHHRQPRIPDAAAQLGSRAVTDTCFSTGDYRPGCEALYVTGPQLARDPSGLPISKAESIPLGFVR